MMKSKNMPQALTHHLLNYLPLLIALGLVAAWIWFDRYTSEFLRSSKDIFYPLVQPDWGMIFGFVVIAIVVLHGIALYRGANIILTGLSGLGMLGVICFFGLVLWFMRPTAHEIDSVSFNGSLYRLIQVDRESGWDNLMVMYRILKCAPSGNWCRPESTPYIEEYSYSYTDRKGYRRCPLPPEEIHLGVDEPTHQLILYVGEDIYPTHSLTDYDQKHHMIDCTEREP